MTDSPSSENWIDGFDLNNINSRYLDVKFTKEEIENANKVCGLLVFRRI